MKSEQWAEKCQNHGDMRQKQPEKPHISSPYTCPDNNIKSKETNDKKDFQMTKLLLFSLSKLVPLLIFMEGTAKSQLNSQLIHL